MKFDTLIGWGVVIYAVLALSWSGFMMYGLGASSIGLVLQIGVLVLVTSMARRSLRLHLWPDVLPYSLTWAGVVFALDIVYKVPLFGWSFFANWGVWILYVLIVIIPLAQFKKRSSLESV